MKIQHFFHAILAAAAITLVLFLFELLFGTVMSIEMILWNLLANLLIVGVLGFYVVQSQFHSYKLLLSTFAVFYVIGNFNILIEAVLFGVVDVNFLIRSILIGIPYTLTGSLIVIRCFGKWGNGAEPAQNFIPRRLPGWVGRILLANFLYIFFYITAGILIEKYTPGFNEFYEDKLPSMFVFFMTNMFFRGFVFVAIAILIDRSVNGTVLTKSLMVGLVFSVIGGIAPLIPPNEAMPEYIRVAHGIEVGISNFLYGICVLLIVRSKEDQKVALNLYSSQLEKSINP